MDIERKYIQEAKKYLDRQAKRRLSDIYKYGHTTGIPYADPSWSGTETARMMRFQDWFRPTGVDRSEEAMQELSESLSDKLKGTAENIRFATGERPPEESIGDLADIYTTGKYLQKVKKTRGLPMDTPDTFIENYSQFLKGGYSLSDLLRSMRSNYNRWL